ncbi:hypothetical protein [Asticcacaulis excentricus]|uniref:Uncharacterized protein n=1 Tax=Asticcacaulis excentricus (strain ATCC 15261 / DSM 4724 / KCTC 12464 / NCIMB 9791 / VKM B-1370 / CB 48) TaxID=573065 RepID=E8RPN9_ASTEC|nr:hypothetical protein [Asticcacaulis excentricus]ADU12016.1 hypothetical protein Astex_0318 [Asticcacaulis excentricus CB 48]
MTRGTFNRRAYVREFNGSRAALGAPLAKRAEVTGSNGATSAKAAKQEIDTYFAELRALRAKRQIDAYFAELRALRRPRGTEDFKGTIQKRDLLGVCHSILGDKLKDAGILIGMGRVFNEKGIERAHDVFLRFETKLNVYQTKFDWIRLVPVHAGRYVTVSAHSDSPVFGDSDRITRSTGEETRSGGNAGAGDRGAQ